ncbi:hypothetical protein J6590_011742 [Homalodisca vitripennis]|nr:hypothetical protein J6590_011742 [Homalodisca vitripennis]
MRRFRSMRPCSVSVSAVWRGTLNNWPIFSSRVLQRGGVVTASRPAFIHSVFILSVQSWRWGVVTASRPHSSLGFILSYSLGEGSSYCVPSAFIHSVFILSYSLGEEDLERGVVMRPVSIHSLGVYTVKPPAFISFYTVSTVLERGSSYCVPSSIHSLGVYTVSTVLERGSSYCVPWGVVTASRSAFIHSVFILSVQSWRGGVVSASRSAFIHSVFILSVQSWRGGVVSASRSAFIHSVFILSLHPLGRHMATMSCFMILCPTTDYEGCNNIHIGKSRKSGFKTRLHCVSPLLATGIALSQLPAHTMSNECLVKVERSITVQCCNSVLPARCVAVIIVFFRVTVFPVLYKRVLMMCDLSSEKYHGMVLTRRLSTKVAATRRVQTGRTAFMALVPLLRSSSLTTSTKLLLYTLIIRPSIIYAGPAWYNQLAATPRKQLESFQRRAVRFLPGTPWFVRNTVMMRSLGIPTLGDYIKGKLGTTLTQLIPLSGSTSGPGLLVRALLHCTTWTTLPMSFAHLH